MAFQSSLVNPTVPPRVGRYDVIGVLGRGGMATVYLANTAGEAGFSRLVAVKVLHPHLAEQEDFVGMLLDEARLAARIHHPNVVAVVDLQTDGPNHYIVMDYVEGCSLSELLQRNRGNIPPGVAVRIVLDSLNGLHAAHTLTDAAGVRLNLIHRDVTPQNILLGVDGTARLTDFGVALAQSRIHHTPRRELKGKMSFMAPEQIRCLPLDHRADIFSVGCLMWLSLTGKSLFLGASDAATLSNVLNRTITPPSAVNSQSPAVLDSVCVRALERDVSRRWPTAAEMEEALRGLAQSHALLASRKEVAEWVQKTCQRELTERRAAVRDVSSIRTHASLVSTPRAIVQSPSQPHVDPAWAATSTPAHPESVAGSIVPRQTPSWLRSGKLWLTAVAAISVGAIVATVTIRSTVSPPDNSAGTTPSPSSVSRQPPTEILPQQPSGPPEAVPPTAKPGAGDRHPGSLPAGAAAQESVVPSIGVASHGRKARPVFSRRTTGKALSAPLPEPDRLPQTSPPQPSSPQPSSPRPAPATWDKDSPLPPQ